MIQWEVFALFLFYCIHLLKVVLNFLFLYKPLWILKWVVSSFIDFWLVVCVLFDRSQSLTQRKVWILGFYWSSLKGEVSDGRWLCLLKYNLLNEWVQFSHASHKPSSISSDGWMSNFHPHPPVDTIILHSSYKK